MAARRLAGGLLNPSAYTGKSTSCTQLSQCKAPAGVRCTQSVIESPSASSVCSMARPGHTTQHPSTHPRQSRSRLQSRCSFEREGYLNSTQNSERCLFETFPAFRVIRDPSERRKCLLTVGAACFVLLASRDVSKGQVAGTVGTCLLMLRALLGVLGAAAPPPPKPSVSESEI